MSRARRARGKATARARGAAPPSALNPVHLLVALGFGVMFFSSAIKGLYQVYFSDLAAHFGRGRGDFAWSGALFVLVTGMLSPLVGWLADRVGPLRTVLAGCLAAGVTMTGVALFPSHFWVFVVLYGLGAAFALAAMTYVPMGILVDRLFEQKKKGLAYAVITNGTAIGFIVLSPFWIWLQPHVGWIDVFMVVGLLFAGPLALVIWLATRAPMPAAPVEPKPASAGTWGAVRGDAGFYALAFGFFGCGATMAFVDVHLVPFWQDNATPRTQMGVSMSLLGVLELASGLAAGWLATRWDKHALLAIFYALRSLAMLLLLSTTTEVNTFLFAGVFGASYLGTVVITSAYCFERYGAAVKGQVFGVLFMVHQVGAFVSVQAGAWGFDHFHSYRPAIVCLVVLTLVAAVSSWVVLSEPAGDRAFARRA